MMSHLADVEAADGVVDVSVTRGNLQAGVLVFCPLPGLTRRGDQGHTLFMRPSMEATEC